MTENEGRALARTASVLLLAATVRWGAAARAGPVVVPADSALALPGLLEESRHERDEAARRREPLGDGERIDPNRVSEVELDRLPGVGAGTARAIVATREQNGPFASAEELLDVPGIGPATFERMLPHLDLTGTSVVREQVPRRARASAARSQGPAPALSLNAASAEQLNALPGIGPVLADRILAERQERGGFVQVDDLLDVQGIGPATLERLRPLVTVP